MERSMFAAVKRLSWLLAVVGLAWSHGSLFVAAQQPTDDGQWRHYSGNASGTKYSPLDQINKGNVNDLRVVWRWESADRALQRSNPLWRAGRNEETPLMIDGTLYTVTGLGL